MSSVSARGGLDLSDCIQEAVGGMFHSMWKVCPWRARNRGWLSVLLQGYFGCVFGGFLMACVLNSVEGNRWVTGGVRHVGFNHNPKANGATALDECFWFIFTTMHGIAFGEFMPRGAPGRIIAMITCSIGYWFIIFMCCIAMFSQLPGEKMPTLGRTLSRMISAAWPSYVVFCFIIAIVGANCGPYVNHDNYGKNEWPTGIYWLWQTAHRMPFGDLYPDTVIGRSVTVPMSILGLLYMPYCMALVAVRCPSMAQHEALLGELRKHPEDSLGRGYIVPEEIMQPISGGHQTELQTLTGSSA